MKVKYKAMQCQLFPVQLFICSMCKAENKMHPYLRYPFTFINTYIKIQGISLSTLYMISTSL